MTTLLRRGAGPMISDNDKWSDRAALHGAARPISCFGLQRRPGLLSAHFITYAGHRCEGLHGHNYRARVAVHGELDPTDKLVFDFLELKRIMRRLCGEIDHLVLLPLESARIHVAKDAEVVRVSVGPLETARRWRADRNTGQVRPQRLVTAGLASGALPPARVGLSFAAFHGPFAHCVRTVVPVNTQAHEIARVLCKLNLNGWTVDGASMRVRLKRKLSESINGVDLSGAREGDTLDLSPRDALLLIAEGWATPVYDTRRRSERHKVHDRPTKRKKN